MNASADPLRVVHVATGRQWRGGERQVWLLARHLAARGVEQTVVTDRAGRLASVLADSGIRVRGLRWWPAMSPAALAAVLHLGRRGADILHAHDGHAVNLVAAAAWWLGRPFVATRRLDHPRAHPGLWRRANRVIAVSESVRRSLVASGIQPDRVTVVYSGIDPAVRVPRSPDAVRDQLGLPATARLAVTVAALDPTKGHQTTMEAAVRLLGSNPELHWVIAGQGPARPQLEALARNLGVTSNIHFVGHVDDPTSLIAAADVLVHCPSREALGTTILDAMDSGTPVVASRVGGIVEVIGEDNGILVDPGDSAQLAAAVTRVLGDEKLSRDVTKRAKDTVARFTAEGMAGKVLEVYRSVVLDR